MPPIEPVQTVESPNWPPKQAVYQKSRNADQHKGDAKQGIIELLPKRSQFGGAGERKCPRRS